MKSKQTMLCVTGLTTTLLTGGAVANTDTSPFTWGADLRLRQVFIGNVGLDDRSPAADRTFQRYRGRLWGSLTANEHLGASARLIWEGRHYHKPDIPGFETTYSGGVLFDQLTLDLKKIAGTPFSLKLGRQDMRLGDGWLVLDGTPIDGSRTFYFDAARASVELGSLDTQLDIIFIDQNPDTDRFPKALNGKVEDQTEQHETGAILYARNTGLVQGAELDGYFIYKGSRPNRTLNNIRINNGAPFRSPGDEGDVYTIGVRADAKGLIPQWTLRAEGAYQWGTRNGRDLNAFGFTGRATFNLEDPLANRVHAGYEFLSGDDPGSRRDQAFDPLWGRWPQWSELMIYQWPLETRVGEATNLHRFNLGWGMQAHPSTLVTLDYHALWADEHSTRTVQQLANISADSLFRGHLATAWVRTKLNKHVAGHLVAEYLWPGDYYATNRRDESYFVRAEVNLTW